MDDFKTINDRFGHDAGDDVLSQVSHAIGKAARAQDPLIRMGGDEFAVLLAGCPPDKATAIADKVIKACAHIMTHDQNISVSIGMAESVAGDDKRVKDLISAADQAMYVAKALGGGRCEVAEPAA